MSTLDWARLKRNKARMEMQQKENRHAPDAEFARKTWLHWKEIVRVLEKEYERKV